MAKNVFVIAFAISFCSNGAFSVEDEKKLTVPEKNRLVVKDNLIRNPLWGVELQIPGYAPWDDYPMGNQANFVLAAESDVSCGLNISLFVETIEEGTTSEECRLGYPGSPGPLAKDRDVVLHEQAVSPITFTLFDYVLEENLLNNQLYAYWTRRDLCFELHISSMNCKGFEGIVNPIFGSVKILEDQGVTLETVNVAMNQGGDPRDWLLHFQVASIYLHRMEPSKPERARRFYESSLTLGKSSISPRFLWLIEEGIGITWLSQDIGDKEQGQYRRQENQVANTRHIGT